MKVKEIIEKLKTVDQELHLRVENSVDNLWVFDVEEHNTGSSGYEIEGEIVLLITE